MVLVWACVPWSWSGDDSSRMRSMAQHPLGARATIKWTRAKDYSPSQYTTCCDCGNTNVSCVPGA
eukprot:235508-Chlamydomonas_euryale.AAC.3